MAQIWATAATPRPPTGPVDPTSGSASLIPSPGATSIALFDFPPDEVMQNPADLGAMVKELSCALPGLFEMFEPDAPGMHVTPTVDYGIILEGELWLVLDNGESRQSWRCGRAKRNRHAWRNKTSQVARALFVMIGAQVSPGKTGTGEQGGSDERDHRSRAGRRILSVCSR